jgi:formylmethanofuran dehydrogenase subunit B
LKLQNGIVVDVEKVKTNGKAAAKEEIDEDDDDEALDAVDAIIDGKKQIKESEERIGAAHAPYFPIVSCSRVQRCKMPIYKH